MRTLLRRAQERLGSPSLLRSVHGRGAWFWIAMAVPSILWWRDSVPYLVGISVYAVVTGHWSAWQASRVEDQQQATLDELRELIGKLRAAGEKICIDDPST